MYAAENPFSMDEYYHFLDETRGVRFIAHGMWSFFGGRMGTFGDTGGQRERTQNQSLQFF